MPRAKLSGIASLVILLAGCGSAGPEAEIREHIAFMQQAVEARESGAAVKYLADHFNGASTARHSGACAMS
jgi:hypothetical protein